MPSRSRARAAEFAAAYETHVDFVWRVLARRGVEPAALEDATQEVFIIAHRRWGAWEGQASMRAWLYGVARHVASNHYRTRSRRQRKQDSLAAQLSAASPDLDARLDDRARLKALAAAIDRLEPRQREIFVLADVEGLTAPEIAELLGCKLNTVYSRLRTVRALFAKAVAREEAKRQRPRSR